MGEILGLGITHYPPCPTRATWRAASSSCSPTRCCRSGLRSPEGWHPTMREQWGADEGAEPLRRSTATDLIHHFRKARAELDAFEPDFVLLWGDDQYENFREDCVPPFSVLAYESVEVQPWKGTRAARTGGTSPRTRRSRSRATGRAPSTSRPALLAEGVDIAYAYKPLPPSARPRLRELGALPGHGPQGVPVSRGAVHRERLRPLADRRARRAR